MQPAKHKLPVDPGGSAGEENRKGGTMNKRCRCSTLIAFGLLVLTQDASARGCRDAVFSVEGGLPSLSEDVGPISIRFVRHKVALAPICPARRARLRRTPRGLSVSVRWQDCEGLAKGVRLRLQTAQDCSKARGVIRTGSPRAKHRFRAIREDGDEKRRRPRRLRTGFESTLEQRGGCGDAFLFASNPDDTVALFFSTRQLAERAHEAGHPTTFSMDLASEEAALWVHGGENVSHSACNDALSLQTRVARELRAVSGRVTVTVTPSGPPTPWGEFPADVTLHIEDATLAPDGDPEAEAVHLDSFEMNARIGWVIG